MQEINIHLNNEHSVGLGDNLCLLTALTNVPYKVILHTTNDYNTLDRLKEYCKILRIQPSKLEIVEASEHGKFNNTGWPLKLFSDYYKPLHLNVNGQILRTDNRENKKCVAIAGFYADKPENHNNEWPWCKHRPLEFWARLFSWLKSMDYEVITVDRIGLNLENKIELLVKNCRAIISYEGGMAHLSHMLGIPCFLIDWQFPTSSTTLGDFHCDFVHMTNSVYIVRDDEELFNWDINTFNQKINDLRARKTNNRFMNGSHTMHFEVADIHGNVSVLDSNGNTVLTAPPIFGDSLAAEFIREHFWLKWSRNQKQRIQNS